MNLKVHLNFIMYLRNMFNIDLMITNLIIFIDQLLFKSTWHISKYCQE